MPSHPDVEYASDILEASEKWHSPISNGGASRATMCRSVRTLGYFDEDESQDEEWFRGLRSWRIVGLHRRCANFIALTQAGLYLVPRRPRARRSRRGFAQRNSAGSIETRP